MTAEPQQKPKAKLSRWRWLWLTLSPLPLLALLMGVGMFVGTYMFAAPGYEGPVSDHFDGKQFHNQGNVKAKTFGDVLKWWRKRDQGPWRDYRVYAPGEAPPPSVQPGELRVTFINHATTLVQIDGVNILTDPIYSKRASPVSWAGPARVRPPGIRFGDLPRIHAVVISHNHYDHLDVPTLRRLHKKHRPVFFAGLGTRRLLRQKGIHGAVDLDWWQARSLTGGVRVIFVPAQHWSSRGIGDRNNTLWGGFVFQGVRQQAFFAGDTGFGPHFAQIRARFGPMDLALLPIGAYKPRWFMKPMHMNPAEAVLAHQVLGARKSVAIHYGTFPLADDGQDDPERDLVLARAKAGLKEGAFRALGFGKWLTVPAAVDRPRARPISAAKTTSGTRAVPPSAASGRLR